MHREDEHGQPGMLGVHVAHQLEAIALPQRDVYDRDIRLEIADCSSRFPLALRLSAHCEIRLEINHATQPLAHNGMIIDDQYASRGLHGNGKAQRTQVPPSAGLSIARSPPSIC